MPVFSAAITSVSSGNWDDPATWGGTSPAGGDTVSIAAGHQVIYNVDNSANHFHMITVDGTLSFSRTTNTTLNPGNIIVRNGGYLDIGNTTNPIPATVKTVILLHHPHASSSMPMIDVQAGGKWTVHGRPMQYTWTKLAQTVNNTNIITVDDNVDWNVGDEIVIGSSSLRQMEFEKKTITAISGKTITLDSNLNYEHTGEFPEKTEVIHLTRNVIIKSIDPAMRGHTRFLENSIGDVRFARFDMLGPRLLGSYPLHFHQGKSSQIGSVVYGNAITDSDNRWITVHSTIGLNITNNVGFNASGHGYFLEIGDEYGNTLENNAGIYVKAARNPSLTPEDVNPSVFWLQSGNNTVRGNIASSSDSRGFWIRIPDNNNSFINPVLNYKTVPIAVFDNNEAHSNVARGLDVEPAYGPTNGTISNFKAWRNKERGVWARIHGNNLTYQGGIIFGNPIGSTFPSRVLKVRDVVYLGETDRVFAQGKTAAYPNAFKGYEVYDGPQNVTNITARNHFSSTASYSGRVTNEKVASDVGIKEDNRFSMDPATFIKDSSLQSPVPVFFQTPRKIGEMEAFVNFENVVGTPQSTFCVTRKFNYDPASCTFNSSWNAYICTGSCDTFKPILFTGNLTNASRGYVDADVDLVRRDINERKTINGTTNAATFPDKYPYRSWIPRNRNYDIMYRFVNNPIVPKTNLTLADYSVGATNVVDPISNYTESTSSILSKITFSIKPAARTIVVTALKKPANITYFTTPLVEASANQPANNTWYYDYDNKLIYIYVNR